MRNRTGQEVQKFWNIPLEEALQSCERLAHSHYENFPIATLLLPKKLRPHFYSTYAFCRGTDDLGDEAYGDRKSLLTAWEEQLELAYKVGATPSHPFFIALQHTISTFKIPKEPFQRIIEANHRDQRITRHENLDTLKDYCTYSANPVGHIVLYIFGCAKKENFSLSDATCTALQLTNFWQDVKRDYDKGRIYLPLEDMERYGVKEEHIATGEVTDGFKRLMQFEVSRTREMFIEGSRLLKNVPRGLGVDLALFTWGGLETLKSIERIDYDVLSKRPTTSKFKFMKMFAVAAFRSLAGVTPLPYSAFATSAPS